MPHCPQHRSQKTLSDCQAWLCPSLPLNPPMAPQGPPPKPVFEVFHIPAISPSTLAFVSAKPWPRHPHPALPGRDPRLPTQAAPGRPLLRTSPALSHPLWVPVQRGQEGVEKQRLCLPASVPLPWGAPSPCSVDKGRGEVEGGWGRVRQAGPLPCCFYSLWFLKPSGHSQPPVGRAVGGGGRGNSWLRALQGEGNQLLGL